MLKKSFIAAALAIVLLVGTNPVMALDPIPKQSGFSGYIQPGPGYLSIKSNTVAKVLSFDLSDKSINNLNDEPDSESMAIFTVPYKLAYTFAGTRTELFLGTELGDLLAFDTAQQLGVKQEVGSLGCVSGRFTVQRPGQGWRDPYVTGSNRDATGRKNMGGQVVWDKVFGSNLELEYSLRTVDITNEASGNFLGLTGADRDRLDRNGTVHRARPATGSSLETGTR